MQGVCVVDIYIYIYVYITYKEELATYSYICLYNILNNHQSYYAGMTEKLNNIDCAVRGSVKKENREFIFRQTSTWSSLEYLYHSSLIDTYIYNITYNITYNNIRCKKARTVRFSSVEKN